MQTVITTETLSPADTSIDSMPIANAISVAVGMPLPLEAAVPPLMNA